MNHLLGIEGKVPLVVAPSIVTVGMILVSVFALFIRLLELASKAMIIAMTFAMRGGAPVMRS